MTSSVPVPPLDHISWWILRRYPKIFQLGKTSAADRKHITIKNLFVERYEEFPDKQGQSGN